MRSSYRPRRGHFSASGLVGAVAGLTAAVGLVVGAMSRRWELFAFGCGLAAFTLLCVRVHLRETRGAAADKRPDPPSTKR